MNKLSRLQKAILSMAKDKGPITNGDVLQRAYGFPVTRFTRVQRFDRDRIGMKKYLSGTSASSRALSRLRERGLMQRGAWGSHELTDAGWRLVRNG
jgi:hypothetical protein